MSISKDNELDTYGVWVKHSATSEDNMNVNTDDLDNLDDFSLDLPDFPDTDNFDDTDFSDMFKDDNQFSSEKENTDIAEATLTNDELANIANTTTIEPTFDDLAVDIDLSNISDIDENDETDFDIEAELADLDTEIELPKMELDQEPNFDTFEVSSDTATEETEDFSFGEDEEISLDDFMDEGFSDESVAAGNNGYEPGKEPTALKANESEEVSLDDFMDFMEETPKEQTEDIVDEKPLEMDIAFDESAESVMTEDNLSVESFEMDEDYDETTSAAEPDEMFTTETTSSVISSEEFGESEEIDLSDFGIDANAEETAVTQDVEASKAKEVIVDYDLSVGEEDNLSSAPIVNEIKTDKKDENSSTAVIPEGSSIVETSLLQQIVSDLSSLKNEIDNLKKNLSDINNSTNLDTNLDIPVEEETAGGFFDSDDTDETIALSGDELNNIMNTADFTEETIEQQTEVSEDESIENFEEDSFDTTTEESEDEVEVVENGEPEFEETFATPDGIELSNDNATDEIILAMDQEEDDEVIIDSDEKITEENEFTDIGFEDNTIEEDSLSPIEINELDDNIIEESIEVDDPDLVMDFDDSALTEPDDLDNISSEIEDDSDLPDEISIPKDDILVESSETDVFESTDDIIGTEDVIETEEADESFEEFETTDDLITNEDSLETSFDEIETESDDFADVDSFDTFEEDEEETEVPTVDGIIEKESLGELINDKSEEFETTEDVIEEQEIELSETSVEEPEDDTLVSSFETSETVSPVAQDKKELNSDLKAEIKSVLLYMDQLLENLPEEKIMEFANSEEFSTYKKLFSDLGLS